MIAREKLDEVLGLVDREIWIVTASDGNRRGGLVATWVSQASIDRSTPVMLAGIAPNHFTAELVEAGGAFALHLLSRDQIDHAWNFALGSGRQRDKLSGLASFVAETGSPVLSDCLAWLDCRVFARLPTGDRTFYWADVVAGGMRGQGPALKEGELIEAASAAQRDRLRAELAADVALQRPLQRAWREQLPSWLQPPVSTP